ncbi:MAG TPA: VWA domain-containing protein [Pyrinomonadaceae bacterium]|nr:VWA domain-containing protein [Pyrinomonadaceae bacterium]
MDFRTKTRTRRAGLLLPIAAAVLALASAFAAARAQSGRQIQPTQQQQQTPTPTLTPTPPATPTPTPGPSESQTPTPTPTPDEEVERIESDVTNVLLSATDDKRRFVTTVTSEDVRLLEDGVPQQITYFQHETDTPLSIVLLVDTSASQERVVIEERDAASAFVRSVLRAGKDNASVLSFTGVTRLDQPPTGDAPLLLSAINSLKVEYTEQSPVCQDDDAPLAEKLRCRTAVWDAVVLSVREVLSKTPETTRRAVILVSDGDDTASKLRIYQAVEYAVRNNTVVYSMGIRDRDFKYGEMRKDFLRIISESTGGRAFFPRTTEDIAAAYSQIEQELRSQYLLSYTSTNRNSDGGYRKVQIEVTNPQLRKQKLRLLYRQGYYARQTMK